MLTQRKVEAASVPLGRKFVKLTDTMGLFLRVTPTAKTWHVRMRENGRDTSLALGDAEQVPLAEARKLAILKRDHVGAARDVKANRAATFGAMLDDWMSRKTGALSVATRGRLFWLSGHLKPLRSRPANEITTAEIVDLLRAVEKGNRNETAHRARGLISRVFDDAIASGRHTSGINPAASTRGALQPVSSEKRAAITEPKRFGQLLRAISAYGGRGMTALALELLPLLACRPGELRHAKWGEFHLDGKEPVWRVPAERMKMKLAHIVPLSHQAVTHLRGTMIYTEPSEGGFVFEGRGTRPLSENAFGVALAAIGFDGEHTAHGFRSSFSSLMHEKGFSSDIIELCLAHKIPGVKGIYNRSERLDERRKVMQAWADYCDELRGNKDQRT